MSFEKFTETKRLPVNKSFDRKLASVVLLLSAQIFIGVVCLTYRSCDERIEDVEGVADRGSPLPLPPIVVHIIGRVQTPGVFTLEPGARVIDAIAKAGGTLPDADIQSLNLARPLRDEEQLVIESLNFN